MIVVIFLAMFSCWAAIVKRSCLLYLKEFLGCWRRKFFLDLHPPKKYSYHQMHSLDIIALYTSIPTDLAIETILNILNDQPIINIPNDTLKTLLEIATHTYFTFNDQFYKQSKGLAMGSPISGFLANIFIYHNIENNPIYMTDYIIFYRRYVDDIFILMDPTQQSISQHCHNINKINPNIQFTYESENNQTLTFLDLKITRIPNSHFLFSVAHKS